MHSVHSEVILELPYLNADHFQIFIDLFAQAFPESLNLLLLDNSGAHTAQQVTLPDNGRLVFLPPYCPELNPIERVWLDLKDALARLHFPTLERQQDYVARLLRAYEAATLHALPAYPYLIEAVHALVASRVYSILSRGGVVWARLMAGGI
jgi:DDE superfamily endonuclease